MALERVNDLNGRTNWFDIVELREAVDSLVGHLDARMTEVADDEDAHYLAEEAWTEAADINTLLEGAIALLEAIHTRINDFDPEV